MACWKSDFNKVVITANFERRGWHEADETSDVWDIYWANVNSIRQVFAPESLVQLQDGQLINHFPNHFELTRKDLLIKNIKRYHQQVRKDRGQSLPPIIPSSYVLPQDYALFVEEFRKNASSTYILKPTAKAQGKGIFLINKLSQVRQRAAAVEAAAALSNVSHPGTPAKGVPSVFMSRGNSSSSRPSSSTTGLLRPALENHIVSKYIDNPLLLGGKKFDIRLYVLVVSYSPLVAYLSTLGFARFCNVKFTRELAELDNMFVHLTNVAVQKGGGDAYNVVHGNKWLLEDLRLHLEAIRGHAATDQLFKDMQELVVHTLKAVQPVAISDRHCFELYGFDVIIDNDLQPWLIEVNASPSLTTTTKADRLLKFKVINDAISIVTPQDWSTTSPSNLSSRRTASRNTGVEPRSQYPAAVGSMQLIHDDSCHVLAGKQRPISSKHAASVPTGAAVSSKQLGR